MYVRVKGLDAEGRLSLLYVGRERDRPKPPNRRERRAAERGQASSDSPRKFLSIQKILGMKNWRRLGLVLLSLWGSPLNSLCSFLY